jgi:N-carbamoyl-L-amino-acid hydrolase/ureidoglycolate amidohydrolase
LRAVHTAYRLGDAIEELAGFNDDPAAGGITREVYTPTYRAALDRVAGWMGAE